MSAATSDVDRSRAVHPKRNLVLKAPWMHRIAHRWVWRCPRENRLSHFRDHLTSNHLEVGAGSSRLLAEALPAAPLRLVVLDVRPESLRRAARHLAPLRPDCLEVDLLSPLQIPGGPFDSISVSDLLHYLPGRLEDKAAALLDRLLVHLREEGILFGSTILGKDLRRPLLAPLLMWHYNRRGIFHNDEDSLGGLMEALSQRFRIFNVEVQGCVVLFWGKGVRTVRPPEA